MEHQNENILLTNETVYGEEICKYLEAILKSTNNKVGDKHIILKSICSRDIIRRIFYINTVDDKGSATSYRQVKYYYQNAAKNGIDGTTKTKNRDLGVITPDTKEFRELIDSYIKKGYSLCAE